MNEDAVESILLDTDTFIEEWIGYPEEITRVRRLILEYTNTDILEGATHVPDYLRDSEEV